MAASGRQSEIRRTDPSSRGPWLAVGLCCPVGSRRTMASSEPLAASCWLMASSTGLCVLLVARGSPIYSACLSHRAISGPRRTERLHETVASPFTVAFAVFAAARHPQSRAFRSQRGVSRGGWSSHPLRPDGLLALHRPGRLRSSFHLLSRLRTMSSMTTRVDSQFPRPVFHRRDTQPYGLRAKVTNPLLRTVRILRDFMMFRP